MSANLALVRSIYADWEQGDFSSARWAHPQVEFVVADGPGTWIGLAAMAERYGKFLRVWKDYRGAVDGYREIDDDRVLALGHRTGRAKASGFDLAQMQNRSAALFEIHDGRVTRLARYMDPDRALADLGLEG